MGTGCRKFVYWIVCAMQSGCAWCALTAGYLIGYIYLEEFVNQTSTLDTIADFAA